MNLTKKVLMVCLALAVISSAQAVEVSGVRLDDTVQAANTSLKFNGAGVRYKVFFKVYIAALYLSESKNTTEGILALSGPKQINLSMLRDVSSDSLGQAFLDGLKRNSDKAERSKFLDQFLKLGQLFASVPELKKGEVLSIQWLPSVGTNIFINVKRIGETFPDEAFFNALLKIWLGENPVDAKLKDQMLGITANHAK